MFCYQKNFTNPTLPVDEAQFYALVRATQWNENIDKYRETGEASLKRKLPAFIFQATFDETTSKTGKTGRWRKQAATRLTGLVVMDVDHVENPCEVFEGWGVLSPDILLVYVTPSGKGLKVVFKADTLKGNLIDNQHSMAKLLGVEVDESCKDASRMSFICKESDILYINKELFTYENREFAEKYNEQYRGGRTQPTLHFDDARAVAGGDTHECAVRGTEAGGQGDDKTLPLSFKGRPYSEIIEEWWKRQGGEPQEGERNVKLYQLAVNLRAICDNNKALMLRVMPRLGLEEEEVRSIVESACKEPPKGISKVMREITQNEVLVKSDDITNLLDNWGAEIESLFTYFPLLEDVCAGLKRSQYPAAVFTAGGALMTLMTRCTYRFYHRPERERRLNCSLLIIGHPASNKSMADDICDILMSPVETADKAGLAALNRYKQDTKKRAANKEGKDRPQGIIRIHPARTSNGQLIQDMLNAKEVVDGKEMQLHMFTFDTELDNSITLQSGGSWINKQSMELKAFHNEEDGQMYQNSDSPVDKFHVTWNYIYTGTPIALKKKVNERNFGSGLSTRLTVIPMPKTNYEMIAFQEVTTIDWQRLERMKTWAFKLDVRAGELPMWPLVKRLYDWTKNRMADCAEDDSEANELMLKRVPYHALNYSAPFIDMRHYGSLHQEGKFWEGSYEVDETDWKLCELMARIQYATQQHFFGVLAEKYFDDMNNDVQITGRRHYQKSQEGYQRLPEVFTLEDVRRCYGYDKDASVYTRIRRLTDSGNAEKIQEGDDKGKYRKIVKMLA